MLVGFLGAPCSGKTTTAAHVFAELKELGIPSEFITEKARTFVAYRRLAASATNEAFALSDLDQSLIAHSQSNAEEMLVRACGLESVIVTDSCAFNSALYMSDEYLHESTVKCALQEYLSRYDLLFLCPTVPRPSGLDLNRVHSAAESETLQDRLHELLEQFDHPEVVLLLGESHWRVQDAMGVILDRVRAP